MKKKLLCTFLVFSLLLPVVFAAPAAAPLADAATGFTWAQGQAMPTFAPPAAVLDAIDVRDLSFAERLAVACLQGIVNRTQPRIFLVDRDADSRDAWGDDLGLAYAWLPDWQTAVEKYLPALKGIVIFNPLVPDTANVATTIAGLTDSLAVSPELAALLTAAPFSLPVTRDLRNVPIWDKCRAYRWLYENYWAGCTRRTICGLVPDGHTPLRDFAVAVRAAVLWLDANIPEEQAVLKLFFDGTKPLDCFYTGWWPNEPPGIAFASTYGVMTIASDFYSNYTVYSAMPKELEIPQTPAKPVLENQKIYVACIISDGDNIQYDQGAMRVERLWGSAERGKVPIGWTFSPVMLDAGPQILNWYYQTATENDVLLCGPSGLGYSTAAQWPNKAFVQQYGAMTNAYFERSAFNIITVWYKLTGSRAEWFAGAIPSLLGLTTQFDTGPKIRFTSNNTPVVWLGSEVTKWSMSYDSGIDNMLSQLTAAAEQEQKEAQFFACQGNVWETSVTDFVRLQAELEAAYPGRFVFVRPDHFMMLLSESHGKPYPISLQVPTSAFRASGTPSAGSGAAVDGSFTTGWECPAPGEATLQLELGEDFVLDRYVLKNAETNYQPKELNTRAWELQINDGAGWKTIDKVSGNSDAIVYRDLKGQTAKQIRLVVKDAGADGAARVQELEVYGVSAARANDPVQRLKGFFYDLWVCLNNLVYEVVEWVRGMQGA
ncbi:MAG: hypothetical protein LBS96_09840 [Oscillospiraceae bacterium]|jgi:hypothetical protein|nr:hypothetical protein [Oscillospiraceae bacterium]